MKVCVIGGGASGMLVSLLIAQKNHEVVLLEKASVLYEQKKGGTLIAHFRMGVSDTAYQEIYIDIFSCRNTVNATASSYAFYINLVDGGIVNLSANNADSHPVGYFDLGIG